jgi:hypothetical protein
MAKALTQHQKLDAIAETLRHFHDHLHTIEEHVVATPAPAPVVPADPPPVVDPPALDYWGQLLETARLAVGGMDVAQAGNAFERIANQGDSLLSEAYAIAINDRFPTTWRSLPVSKAGRIRAILLARALIPTGS